MSAMKDMFFDANHALDLYVQYMEYGRDDKYSEGVNEELRWEFIDAAVAMLEKMTDRKVEDELTY